MIGSLDKSYNRPIIIDEGQLRYLSSIAEERFCIVKYEIYTSDGAKYKLASIDEVLAYSNPDSRRIIKINIWADKNKDGYGFYPAFSLSIFDMAKYDASCILSLNNLEESEITYITQRIDEFVKGAYSPYWWIHRPAFYIVVGILLYIIVCGAYFLSLDKEKWSEKANNAAVLSGWSVICMAISTFLIKRIIEYLFPEGGFAIGEQIKYMKKKDKMRGMIFITIIGSIVIGVISGLLTHLIIG